MEPPRFRRGFTLVELMMVLGIISIISIVVIINQNSFNKTIILANTAYDVALSLRSAQTYGLTSRVAGTSVNTGYGLNFQKARQNSFTFFADTYPAPSTLSVCHFTNDPSGPDARPGNCTYESAQGEKVVDYALGNGITISDFCANPGGSWSCAYANGGGLSSLDIVFARPNPDPFISVNGTYSDVSPATGACIAVTSPQGGAHFVSIAASGQISANATSCP